MKPFFCKLTGGHIYHDLTLEVKRDPYSRKTVFKNRCLKCGKEYKFECNLDPIIDREIQAERNRRVLYSALPKEGEQK